MRYLMKRRLWILTIITLLTGSLMACVAAVPQPAPVPTSRPEPTATAQPEPTATAVPEPSVDTTLLAVEALGNIEYKSEWAQSGTAPLTDGEYREPAAPGSATETVVRLTEHIAFGQLNGQEAAAVVLVTDPGGSGTFFDLAIVVNQAGTPVNVATANLGDRVKINTLGIESNETVVDLVVQSPGDPMCCPTQREVRRYALQGEQIVQTSGEVIGQAEPRGEPAALEGTLWKLESYQGGEGDTVGVLAGTEVTAEFQAGQVTGNTGCNGYSGSYEVDGDNLTIAGPFAMTQRLCAAPEGIMDQERLYLGNLASSASYQITADQLEIRDAAGEVRLRYRVLEPTPLAGTTWQLLRYNNGRGGLTSARAGTEITAVFGDDGQVTGNASCNNYFSSYEVDGNNLSVASPIGMTQRLCAAPEGIMDQERLYLGNLESSALYQITGDQLEIRDAAGEILLRYRVLEPTPLAGTAWQLLRYNNGRGGLTSARAGTEITAVFGDDGQVTGNASCNNYFGSYEVDGAAVRIGPLATTRKMCSVPEGIMQQETDYLAALDSAILFSIDGNSLEFINADGQRAVTFTAAQEAADSNIMSVVWHWQQTVTPTDRLVPDDPSGYTLQFLPGGRVAIQADCNAVQGTYTATDSQLSIETSMTTMAACPPGSLEQEYLRDLNAAAIYFMEGGDLFIDLMYDSGIMRFSEGL